MPTKTYNTLTGLAIGDALGLPFETMSPFSSVLQEWNGTFQSCKTNTLCPHLKKGQWSDDTKMAKALSESLVECHDYSPVGALQKYLHWYRSGDLRGIGNATSEALRKASQGVSWLECGTHQAEGNGSAMRAAP